jgi:steroid 5-alpha reductase family enzyme
MIPLIVVYVLAVAMTWAGSQAGVWVGGLPIFAWCALLAFGLQWLAFVPAYLKQTELFYDLTGSLGFISATLLALLLADTLDARSLLLAACVLIWAARLGGFLFLRIFQDGADSRFDRIKPDPLRFFITWSLQGLWILVAAGCALAAISAIERSPLTAMDALGAGLWLLGWLIEVIADWQKRQFRAAGKGEGFIQSGLWRYSRHPNYFGEIMLWTGIAMLALPALQGWQLATLVSPVFVYLLLTRVSGIPLLEKKADEKWGARPDYQRYKSSTPVLVPRPVRRKYGN